MYKLSTAARLSSQEWLEFESIEVLPHDAKARIVTVANRHVASYGVYGHRRAGGIELLFMTNDKIEAEFASIMSRQSLIEGWLDSFSAIEVNNDDEILSNFMEYEAGMDRFEVLQSIEKRLDTSVWEYMH